MDEEKYQDDFRTYKERSCFHYNQRPILKVYVLLGVSFLLIGIYYVVVLSQVATLSTDLSQMDFQFPNQSSDLDLLLFPCGPENREWEYFNGKCYHFSLEKTSWMQAKTQCQGRHSHLVVINNMAEQNFLQTRTRNERYWMGLTDLELEGHWRWVDGSDYRNSFTYWGVGEPNNDNYRTSEDCAHLWGNGAWNDVYCTYLCFYICEKPLPHPRPAN
ncbi:hepatic lectin-like [Hemicordylus capensis]|uniref:hepatic lectin-like n=1 Tax=Hemicordylus capensis TaxID=884348 RepID=UPI002304C0A9|nr:hepatic lectin-like [Hemicordylus capensis]